LRCGEMVDTEVFDWSSVFDSSFEKVPAEVAAA
jgi:hypothetical protein